MELYKKTFWSMQAAIGLVTLVVAVKSRDLTMGLAFMAMMQVGALLGALVGTSLTRFARRT